MSLRIPSHGWKAYAAAAGLMLCGVAAYYFRRDLAAAFQSAFLGLAVMGVRHAQARQLALQERHTAAQELTAQLLSARSKDEEMTPQEITKAVVGFYAKASAVVIDVQMAMPNASNPDKQKEGIDRLIKDLGLTVPAWAQEALETGAALAIDWAVAEIQAQFPGFFATSSPASAPSS